MSKSTSNTVQPWVCIVALLLIVAGLYWPVLGFDFTGYDDNEYVTENPSIQRGLTPETVAWAFTTGHASNWHPLTWMSHAADWQFAGPKPWLHHATNVALHAINAVLLFILLKRSTGTVWPSFAVAVLFAVHPLNVESVAWVAERKNVLSMFFGLGSLIAYAEYVSRGKRSLYAVSVGLLACGLMSKPMLVTWPFLMVLLDYWPLARIKSPVLPLGPFMKEAARSAAAKWPFFAMAVLSSVITYLVQSHGGAAGGNATIPLLYRLGNAVVSYGDYILMTVWPFGLAALYPHPFETLALWRVLAALVALAIATALILIYGKDHRYLVTGWFVFLGTLVPVIGIVQVGSQAMADRYAYVPLIGLFVIAVWGGGDLCARWRLPQRAPWIAGVAVVLLLSLRTRDQLPYWRNDLALWEHAVAVTSGNYIAHNNLGNALLHAKQPDRALAEFKESLRIRPNHPGAMVSLGNVLLDQRRPDDAAKLFEKALQLDPRHGGARMNLALAYMQMRELDKALEQARAAEQLLPGDPKVYNLLGILSDLTGKPDDAVKYFQRALEIAPGYTNAKANLDRLVSKQRLPK